MRKMNQNDAWNRCRLGGILVGCFKNGAKKVMGFTGFKSKASAIFLGFQSLLRAPKNPQWFQTHKMFHRRDYVLKGAQFLKMFPCYDIFFETVSGMPLKR